MATAPYNQTETDQNRKKCQKDSTSQKIFDLEKQVFLLVLASVNWW